MFALSFRSQEAVRSSPSEELSLQSVVVVAEAMFPGNTGDSFSEFINQRSHLKKVLLHTKTEV